MHSPSWFAMKFRLEHAVEHAVAPTSRRFFVLILAMHMWTFPSMCIPTPGLARGKVHRFGVAGQDDDRLFVGGMLLGRVHGTETTVSSLHLQSVSYHEHLLWCLTSSKVQATVAAWANGNGIEPRFLGHL